MGGKEGARFMRACMHFFVCACNVLCTIHTFQITKTNKVCSFREIILVD